MHKCKHNDRKNLLLDITSYQIIKNSLTVLIIAERTYQNKQSDWTNGYIRSDNLYHLLIIAHISPHPTLTAPWWSVNCDECVLRSCMDASFHNALAEIIKWPWEWWASDSLTQWGHRTIKSQSGTKHQLMLVHLWSMRWIKWKWIFIRSHAESRDRPKQHA